MTNQINNNWHGSIALSIFLHSILVAVFLFGVPSFFENLPQEQEVMTFEILPLSSIVNVKNETKSTSVDPEIKKSREIKKTDVKKEPTPTPPKEIEKEVIKEVPKKAKEKTIIPKAKEEKKDVVEKKVTPKKEDDSIDSILKNLEKDSNGDNTKTSKKNTSSSKASKNNSRGDYNDDYPLSITEKLLIKNQIKKHWREPAGASNLEAIKITLHVSIEKNGVINNAVIKSIICPLSSNEMCNLIEESTLRAVKKASPLQNLSPDRYDIWKEFDIEFIPSFLQ